jgi:hypothetical protein
MKLTDYQIDFIVETFFTNHKEGARKLVENGSLIIAGDDRLWIGGVGNFIATSRPSNMIGCMLYEFEYESFISSSFYREYVEKHISILQEQRTKIKTQINQLYDLLQCN